MSRAAVLLYHVLYSPIRRSAADGTVVEFARGGGLSHKAMGRDAGSFFLAEGVRCLLLIPYHTTKSYETVQKSTIPCHAINKKYVFHIIPHRIITTHTTSYHTTIPYHTTTHHTMPHHKHTAPHDPTIPRHITPYHTAPYHIIPYRITRRHHTTPHHMRKTVRYGTRRGETVRDRADGWDGTE